MTATLSTGLDLRPITPDEFDAYYRAAETAFGDTPRDEVRDMELSSFEFDRSLAVLEAGRPVSTAMAYSFQMTLPGAVAPVAGVTWVSVLPTHRRRGLLTAMMTRQLTELHESGEAVAALFASEPSIYPRFGYGLAARHLALTIPRNRRSFLHGAPAPSPGRVRLAEVADVRPWIESVYDTVRTQQVGHVDRNPGRWTARLFDPEHDREGATPLRCVVRDGDDGVDGYALYATKGRWGPVPDGDVTVREVVATNPQAYADLWHYLLDLDLMGRTKAGVGVDDPIVHWLLDLRAADPQLRDNLYVRIVDVWRALPLRRYAAEVDVVLELDDPVCPWNNGRWRLAAGPTGATCARTQDAPDLALRSTTLGSAYLGAVPLRGMAVAGLVDERTPGAVDALSRALSWAPMAYCREVF